MDDESPLSSLPHVVASCLVCRGGRCLVVVRRPRESTGLLYARPAFSSPLTFTSATSSYTCSVTLALIVHNLDENS